MPEMQNVCYLCGKGILATSTPNRKVNDWLFGSTVPTGKSTGHIAVTAVADQQLSVMAVQSTSIRADATITNKMQTVTGLDDHTLYEFRVC